MRVKVKTDKLHFGILVCMVLFAFSSCSMIGMNNLPKGELMETVSSPNGQYEINSYLVSGNATVDFSVR